MKLPLIIRSHYYKGLLVLLRRDRIIDARERDIMLQIGEVLDFDRRFCEATIDNLLSNRNPTASLEHDHPISSFPMSNLQRQ
jgi:hypothetical protein